MAADNPNITQLKEFVDSKGWERENWNSYQDVIRTDWSTDEVGRLTHLAIEFDWSSKDTISQLDLSAFTEQIQALALAIASGFLIPPAAVAIEAALILCWSFAESILDLRELFHGGRVPLTKTAATWQLSLENLPNLLEGLDSQRRDAKGGMSYEDYLQVLLLSKSKAVKLTRGMDMIEVEIRSTKGKEGFRLDCCIEAAEISVDVEANRKQTFSVTRQYSYI